MELPRTVASTDVPGTAALICRTSLGITSNLAPGICWYLLMSVDPSHVYLMHPCLVIFFVYVCKCSTMVASPSPSEPLRREWTPLPGTGRVRCRNRPAHAGGEAVETLGAPNFSEKSRGFAAWWLNHPCDLWKDLVSIDNLLMKRFLKPPGSMALAPLKLQEQHYGTQAEGASWHPVHPAIA